MLVTNVLGDISVTPNIHSANFYLAKHLSDDDLIAGIERGALKSIEVLYYKYFKNLSRYIELRLNDKNHQFDILNFAFLDIWQGKEKWDRKHSVLVFIFSIIARKVKAVNKLGSQKKKKAITPSLPDSALDLDLRPSAIKDNLAALSAKHKSLIDMVFIHGLTYEQIAVIENCNVKTIKQQYLKAIELLKT